MSLPAWMGRLAQQRLPRGGKTTRLRVHPCLEVLEDRLTPSGDVLALTASAQNLSLGQSSQAVTVQLQDSIGKAVSATNNATVKNANLDAIISNALAQGRTDLMSALQALRTDLNILGPKATQLAIERSAAVPTDFGAFTVGTTTSPVEPTIVFSGLTLANGAGSGIGNFGNPTNLNSTIANNGAISALAAADIDSDLGSVFIINSKTSGNKGTNGPRPLGTVDMGAFEITTV